MRVFAAFIALWFTSCGAALAQQPNANTVYAGPSSGAASLPQFRSLVSADIPSLSQILISQGAITTTLTLNESSGTYNRGLVIAQTGPTTNIAGPFAYNNIVITHLGNVTGGNASAWHVQLFTGGASLNGGGPVIGIYGDIEETITGVTNSIDKIGTVGSCVVTVTDSGGGGCYGLNAFGGVTATGSINRLVGMESDVEIASGGAATYRYAYSAVNQGVGQGSTLDTVFFVGNISNNSGAFGALFTFSKSLTFNPFQTTASLFQADASMTIANVFNLANVTVTGDILNFTNAVLTGNGQLTLGAGLVLTGGIPTVGAGQGGIWASSSIGLVLQGLTNGGAYDVGINNGTGQNVCVVPTGTRILDCNTLELTVGLANSYLANSSMTIAGKSVSLGGTYAPSRSSASASAPTGTTAGPVMVGVAGSITPATSGNIQVHISGVAENATQFHGCGIQLAYGTGSAPANGASPTGTTVGAVQNTISSAAGGQSTFSIDARITGLTLSTGYWFDLQEQINGSGTCTLVGVSMTALEE